MSSGKWHYSCDEFQKKSCPTNSISSTNKGWLSEIQQMPSSWMGRCVSSEEKSSKLKNGVTDLYAKTLSSVSAYRLMVMSSCISTTLLALDSLRGISRNIRNRDFVGPMERWWFSKLTGERYFAIMTHICTEIWVSLWLDRLGTDDSLSFLSPHSPLRKLLYLWVLQLWSSLRLCSFDTLFMLYSSCFRQQLFIEIEWGSP